MRLFVAAAVLAAAPAIADEKPLLERDCMEAAGTMAYGAETYGKGVLTGIVLGYAMAHGMDETAAREASGTVAAACRQTPGMTFGEALAAPHYETGPSTTR